jgi:hypothetical protein
MFFLYLFLETLIILFGKFSFKGEPGQVEDSTFCDHSFANRPNTPLLTEFLFQALDCPGLPAFDLFVVYWLFSNCIGGGWRI